MHIQNNRLCLFLSLGVVGVLLLVFGGAIGGAAAPPLSAEPDWFRASTDFAQTGVPVHLVDASETAVFFEEWFRDRESDPLLRTRGIGHMPSVAPPPRVMQPRDQEMLNERDARGGIFSGSGESRDRTGWGWLADDVQHMRGSGAAGTAGGGAMALPRRFGDADEGFSARRWLDE